MVCIKNNKTNSIMNLFKKKQTSPSAEPIDKNLAIPGITNVIKIFGNAQKKMEPDFFQSISM